RWACCVPIRVNRASVAASSELVGALVVGEDVLEELAMGEELLLLLVAVGPLEVDGQKLPVCCRQLNWVTTSGSTGVPSRLRTKSRKASGGMDPARGSCRDGHMMKVKPCEPSRARVRSATSPFFSRSSTSIACLMIGVPSRLVPFFAASWARVARPFAVLKAAEV